MVTIDDVANDPDWQPKSWMDLAIVDLGRYPHFGRLDALKAHIRELNNGLYIVILRNKKGRNVRRNGKYKAKSEIELPNHYRPTNFSKVRIRNEAGLSATFRYGIGKTTDGHFANWIEYTTHHFPTHGPLGLSLLTSLNLELAVEDGLLEAQINSANYDPSDRSMTVKFASSGELYGGLSFDAEGNLLDTSQQSILMTTGPNEHPLSAIYDKTRRGIQIDPLKTAVALINGFPTQRPLHIEQLIQYNPTQS